MTRFNAYQVQDLVIQCSDNLLDKGVEPLEVAAAHIAHALKIYRTILPQQEYDDLLYAIYDTRNNIDPLRGATCH